MGPSISYEDEWETCTQCVCDHYGVTGCEQGGLPEVPMNPVEASSTAPVMPPVETQPTLESTAPVVQATDEYQDREYDNDHYGEQVEQPAQVEQPVLMEQPVLVEQPPQPPKANVDPNRFAAAGMGAMEIWPGRGDPGRSTPHGEWYRVDSNQVWIVANVRIPMRRGSEDVRRTRVAEHYE